MLKKKLQFSKILAIISAALTVITTLSVLGWSWKYGDASPLLYLIPAVFGAYTAVQTFYFNKSKRENQKGGIIYDLAMQNQEPPAPQQPYEEDRE